MVMTAQRYMSGEEIRLGDFVDLGFGYGPQATVVVPIPSGPAAEGFKAEDWAYLESGFLLQAQEMGLVHYPEADDELLLIRRA